MFVTNHPRIGHWQHRLARIPRWGRIAVLLGVILPIVVLGSSILIVGVVGGLLVLAGVLMILMLVRFGRRLFVPKPVDDGRRNVRIVVHSARVIDP